MSEYIVPQNRSLSPEQPPFLEYSDSECKREPLTNLFGTFTLTSVCISFEAMWSPAAGPLDPEAPEAAFELVAVLPDWAGGDQMEVPRNITLSTSNSSKSPDLFPGPGNLFVDDSRKTYGTTDISSRFFVRII